MVPSVSPRGFWRDAPFRLPNWRTFTSTDIEDVQHHMGRVFHEHQLHARGGAPLAFRHRQMPLKSISFNALDYGIAHGAIDIHSPPLEDIYLFQFSLKGGARVGRGGDLVPLGAGDLWVHDPFEPVVLELDGGYTHFSIKVPRATLEEVVTRELGRRPKEIRFTRAPTRFLDQQQGLAEFVRAVCASSGAGPQNIFAHPRSVALTEEMLARLILLSVPHNYSDLLLARPAHAVPYYVKRVIDHIADHAADPLSLANLCRVSGVSARSLSAGFRAFCQTTPMHYLKNARLDRARDLLSTASGTSVTEVALDCGFNHLSKFSRDYLLRFGERPSDTLCRVRGGAG
ncbi:AraC family transcriptional regulator [Sphingomonas sp. LH128]|uniref:AraC family transcriptional regulator n=1 Tax=Sphingomonas sp. LH128 TaxID=473781 RepID=UPI00027CC7E4|nr:AraC family transcriptional regulator [Sphingomonas sp. LH128]EJU11255.1 AraC family transcriptional regulator [Sphingomonas sp. LH128]